MRPKPRRGRRARNLPMAEELAQRIPKTVKAAHDDLVNRIIARVPDLQIRTQLVYSLCIRIELATEDEEDGVANGAKALLDVSTAAWARGSSPSSTLSLAQTATVEEGGDSGPEREPDSDTEGRVSRQLRLTPRKRVRPRVLEATSPRRSQMSTKPQIQRPAVQKPVAQSRSTRDTAQRKANQPNELQMSAAVRQQQVATEAQNSDHSGDEQDSSDGGEPASGSSSERQADDELPGDRQTEEPVASKGQNEVQIASPGLANEQASNQAQAQSQAGSQGRAQEQADDQGKAQVPPGGKGKTNTQTGGEEKTNIQNGTEGHTKMQNGEGQSEIQIQHREQSPLAAAKGRSIGMAEPQQIIQSPAAGDPAKVLAGDCQFASFDNLHTLVYDDRDMSWQEVIPAMRAALPNVYLNILSLFEQTHTSRALHRLQRCVRGILQLDNETYVPSMPPQSDLQECPVQVRKLMSLLQQAAQLVNLTSSAEAVHIFQLHQSSLVYKHWTAIQEAYEAYLRSNPEAATPGYTPSYGAPVGLQDDDDDTTTSDSIRATDERLQEATLDDNVGEWCATTIRRLGAQARAKGTPFPAHRRSQLYAALSSFFTAPKDAIWKNTRKALLWKSNKLGKKADVLIRTFGVGILAMITRSKLDLGMTASELEVAAQIMNRMKPSLARFVSRFAFPVVARIVSNANDAQGLLSGGTLRLGQQSETLAVEGEEPFEVYRYARSRFTDTNGWAGIRIPIAELILDCGDAGSRQTSLGPTWEHLAFDGGEGRDADSAISSDLRAGEGLGSQAVDSWRLPTPRAVTGRLPTPTTDNRRLTTSETPSLPELRSGIKRKAGDMQEPSTPPQSGAAKATVNHGLPTPLHTTLAKRRKGVAIITPDFSPGPSRQAAANPSSTQSNKASIVTGQVLATPRQLRNSRASATLNDSHLATGTSQASPTVPAPAASCSQAVSDATAAAAVLASLSTKQYT